jgi:hypothetical protein
VQYKQVFSLIAEQQEFQRYEVSVLITAALLAISGTAISASVPESNDTEFNDTEFNDPRAHSCLVEIEFYRVTPATVTGNESPQILRPNYSRGDLLNQKEPS